MKDVIERTAQDLIDLPSWLDGQKRAWQSDKRLTEQYKRQKLSELDAQARQELARKLETLFGKFDPVRGLQGGLVWAMLRDAEARLRQARESYVDTLDATRLANEYRRVPGLLERFSTVEEFERFYDNATAYERRALQDTLTEADLRRRFPGEAGLGHVIKGLRADADAARRSPELDQAELDLAEAHRLAVVAYEASRQAAQEFGEAGFMAEPMKTLGQVRVETRFDPEAGKISYQVSRREPLIAVKSIATTSETTSS